MGFFRDLKKAVCGELDERLVKHNLDWAIGKMRDGYTLSRSGWSFGIRIKDVQFVQTNGNNYSLTLTDIYAEDWQLI